MIVRSGAVRALKVPRSRQMWAVVGPRPL